MAAAAGFFNRQLTAGQTLTGQMATPMDSLTPGTNDATGSSGSSATISANDFLTLLVTEMQNQDPTATTDPNEYINQLVNVNSLEQLIDINQTLTTDLSAPSTSSSGSNGATKDVRSTQIPGAAGVYPLAYNESATAKAADASAAGQSAVAGGAAITPSAAYRRVLGNLGIPKANPAAEHVAHALDGQPRMSVLGGLRASH